MLSACSKDSALPGSGGESAYSQTPSEKSYTLTFVNTDTGDSTVLDLNNDGIAEYYRIDFDEFNNFNIFMESLEAVDSLISWLNSIDFQFHSSWGNSKKSGDDRYHGVALSEGWYLPGYVIYTEQDGTAYKWPEIK